jgi:hypothetical protein
LCCWWLQRIIVFHLPQPLLLCLIDLFLPFCNLIFYMAVWLEEIQTETV